MPGFKISPRVVHLLVGCSLNLLTGWLVDAIAPDIAAGPGLPQDAVARSLGDGGEVGLVPTQPLHMDASHGQFTHGGKLTVKVEAKDEFCVHEVFDLRTLRNKKFKVVMRVVRGGGRDVDILAYNPKQQTVINYKRKARYNGEIEIADSGEWRFCVSNRFSLVSDKVVYLELGSAATETLQAHVNNDKPTVNTYMEAALEQINGFTHLIEAHQVDSRIRESGNQYFALTLNRRVTYWSMGEATLIPLVTLAQVYIVRRMFRLPNMKPFFRPA